MQCTYSAVATNDTFELISKSLECTITIQINKEGSPNEIPIREMYCVKEIDYREAIMNPSAK